MGPYKTPWLTDDVIKSSAFQSVFDMPSNQFVGLNSGYIKDAKDARPGPVVEGLDGEMYAQDSTYTLEGWETEQTDNVPLYYYANSQELGDVYEGNYFNRQENGTISVQGRYQSEEDIRAEWDADQGMGYFKEANPDLDYDTYLSFVKDTSSLVNQGLNRDEDPEPFNALAEQYGINTSFQNDDGDMFEFNGSNFTKTFKTPEADYGRMLVAAGAGAMLAPLATGFASSALGAAGTTAVPLGAGVMGPSTLAASGLAKGIGAGIANAAGQSLVTGKVNPKSVLVSAAMAGIGNPGRWVADQLMPQTSVSTLGSTLGGSNPDSFLSGVVEGGVNTTIADGVVTGNIDLQNSLVGGLIKGAKNVGTDILEDYKYSSPEQETLRRMTLDPSLDYNETLEAVLESGYGRSTDAGALLGEHGLLSPILGKSELNLQPVAEFLDKIGSVKDGVINGFRLGDVIELEDGTRIQASSLSQAEQDDLIDNQGATLFGRQTMGLANNPITNTLDKAFGKVDDGINWVQDKISQGVDFLTGSTGKDEDQIASNAIDGANQKEWDNLIDEYVGSKVDPRTAGATRVVWKDMGDGTSKKVIESADYSTYELAYKNMTWDEKLAMIDRSKVLYNENPWFHGDDGLDEKYTFSDNPRGDTEKYGIARGIDTLYDSSTGNIAHPYSQGTAFRHGESITVANDPVGAADRTHYEDLQAMFLTPSDTMGIPSAGVTPGEVDTLTDAIIMGAIQGAMTQKDKDNNNQDNNNNVAAAVNKDQDKVVSQDSLPEDTNVVATTASDDTVNNTAVLSSGVDDVEAYVNTTQLPSDDTVSSTVVLSSGSQDDVSATSTTEQLPSGPPGTVVLPEEPFDLRNPRNSDPLLWTDLEWRQNNIGYKGKGDRARAYDRNMGMLKQAMAGQALGVDFRLPKGLTDKELYEAGKLT
jgi:hypothetical protein